MKVSLIVPAYNEEKQLPKCLLSLKNQRYTNTEIIVVDNNSTDATNRIAQTYTNLVFTETEKGYIHAVNRGAKEATGDLITFCDADTLYPPDWIEKVVFEFTKHTKAVAVYGTCETHDAKGIMNQVNGVAYTGFLFLSKLFQLDNTAGFNFVIKRDTFFKIGGYDPKYTKMSPDIELGKRLKTEGCVVFNPSIKVYSSFRRFKEGGTVNTTKSFLKSWWEMVRGKEPTTSYESYNQDIR